ncbi:MAG: hypothetical protein ACI9E1_001211 [Cryomorphaceae bacterium]|jgi:hypothetical protein
MEANHFKVVIEFCVILFGMETGKGSLIVLLKTGEVFAMDVYGKSCLETRFFFSLLTCGLTLYSNDHMVNLRLGN